MIELVYYIYTNRQRFLLSALPISFYKACTKPYGDPLSPLPQFETSGIGSFPPYHIQTRGPKKIQNHKSSPP